MAKDNKADRDASAENVVDWNAARARLDADKKRRARERLPGSQQRPAILGLVLIVAMAAAWYFLGR